MDKHLIIRNYLAEKGQELTPSEAKKLTKEVDDLIDMVTPDFAIQACNMPNIDEETLQLILHINRVKAER